MTDKLVHRSSLTSMHPSIPQSPFDACGMILGGKREEHSFNDRYNSFFIDYSLVPLLVQQNYIDSSRNGIFKKAGLDDSQKLEV